MKSSVRLVAAASFLAFANASAFAQDRTIVILDASGSMWGRIDGKPKLDIARQALRSVLRSLPASREVGLMAYGHRDKASCTDIELVVPPAKGTAASIVSAADRLKFLGKTPLADAVKQAAEALRNTKGQAAVVLITDGLETCNADPCAVAAELKRANVNFMAHVVGFGLSAAEGRQVACIAQNTGGRYIRASDAKALERALAQTVTAKPAPEQKPPAQPKPESQRHFPGPELMPHVGLEPTGRTTQASKGTLDELAFPPEGTIAQCQATCTSDKLCAAWRYEPKGSYFVDHARCLRFDYSAEMDYRHFDQAEGWASGMKPDARLLVRPFAPEPAPQ